MLEKMSGKPDIQSVGTLTASGMRYATYGIQGVEARNFLTGLCVDRKEEAILMVKHATRKASKSLWKQAPDLQEQQS